MQTRDTNSGLLKLRMLPWMIVAAIGIVYLLTLDRWFSQSNLPVLSLINGWEWRTYSGPPLLLLLTYPLSWFPSGIQPTLLGLLSTTLALVTLALLARTVMILPQERTRLQRQRHLEQGGILSASVSWLPASVAVLLVGFQLVFWDNATTASGAIIDVALFAYCVRAVAEFRLDRRDAWLFKAAAVFGVAMVNNYAMIAYSPLFVGAILWVKGRDFFSFQFLLRFGLLGCAGLALYLFIPLLHAFSDVSPRGFWGALRDYLGSQKFAVVSYRRVTALFLFCIGILPLLGLAFRWGEAGGDISGASHAITSWMTHIVHLGFLALGIAAAFEFPGVGANKTEISVRFLAAAGGDPSVLSIYFLSALSVGYFLGYFLLIFGTPPLHRWARGTVLGPTGNKVVFAILGLLLIGVPAALLTRNWETRNETRGPALGRFGHRLQESLPDASIAISDTPIVNQLVNASIAAAGRKGKVRAFDSGSLSLGAFHYRMKQEFPARWPNPFGKFEKGDRLESRLVNLFLTSLSLSNQVFYTEPSYGYFFEAHYLVPTGAVYRVHALPVRMLPPNPLTAADIAAADAYWRAVAQDEFAPVLSRFPRSKKESMHDAGASLAAQSFSRALNVWGVAARRVGDLQAGERFFDQALLINSNNPAAFINRAHSLHSRTNPGMALPMSQVISNIIAPFQGRPEVLWRLNGPIDEPSNLAIYSRLFGESGGLYLQSAMMLLRAGELMGDNPEYRLGAARLLIEGRRADLTDMVLKELRAKAPKEFLAQPRVLLETTDIEAVVAHRMGESERAESLLKGAISQFPKENTPYNTLLSIHIQNAMTALRRKETNQYNDQISKGYQVLQSQITAQPTNVSAWVNFGATYMRLEQYTNALVPLTRALELDKNNVTALMNRASSHLKLNQLNLALADYERVRAIMPDTPFQVHYGLGEVYTKLNQKKEAIRHFDEYIKKAPDTAEKEEVEEKLKRLKK